MEMKIPSDVLYSYFSIISLILKFARKWTKQVYNLTMLKTLLLSAVFLPTNLGYMHTNVTKPHTLS